MRDYADDLAVLLQAGKGLEGGLQGVFVQSAEAFVQKERVYPDVLTGHSGQAKCQGQTDDEALTAGEVLR